MEGCIYLLCLTGCVQGWYPIGWQAGRQSVKQPWRLMGICLCFSVFQPGAFVKSVWYWKWSGSGTSFGDTWESYYFRRLFRWHLYFKWWKRRCGSFGNVVGSAERLLVFWIMENGELKVEPDTHTAEPSWGEKQPVLLSHVRGCACMPVCLHWRSASVTQCVFIITCIITCLTVLLFLYFLSLCVVGKDP